MELEEQPNDQESRTMTDSASYLPTFQNQSW